MNVEFGKHVDIVDDRPGKDAAYLLASEKLRDSLSWEDSISLNQGIGNVIEWVDSNIDILEQQADHYIHKA